jgi:SulP family sulfate permease
MRLAINRISLDNFRGDLFGGVTAAVIALPLALAFGVASGMGPIAGLYGAVCVGLLAALFGGTPSQISGPTGPMTIVAASVFTQFGDNPTVAFTVVMMTGGFQILFGYLRIGRYINMMPYPVISGFMTGIGVILIILQLEPLIGLASQPNVVNAITALPGDVNSFNLAAIAIGTLSLIICFALPKKLGRILPSPLVALVACTLIALLVPSVPKLGAVPSGLPDLQVPSLDLARLNYMLVSAAILAALGSIDSLLTSLVADNISRSFHDSNRELVGQGIGNIVAGLAGGLPGAGATVRTLANVKAGGRTPLSGVVHAFVLFLVVLGLGPAVAFVPHAALAGILLKVGIDVIDWRFIRRWHRAPRTDLVLMLVVLLLTVFVDVITAVGVGVVLASLVFVKEMTEAQMDAISAIHGEAGERLLTPEERELFRQCRGHAAILHLAGPMSFGAANEMMRRVVAVESVAVLIIDLSDVTHIDGSAALTIEEIIQRAIDAGQDIYIVGLHIGAAKILSELGVLDLVRETTRFADRKSAIAAAAQNVAETSARTMDYSDA